jgi:exodeoxyribonuclease V alpha subunit
MRCKPPDRTKTDHFGLLEKVIWSDDSQPCSILALTDGHRVIVESESTRFERGVRYRFLGAWQEGNRGLAFKASDYVVDAPQTQAACIRYLCEMCDGIGPAIARRIHDAFGGACVERLRTSPGQVANQCNIPLDICTDAARELERHAIYESTRVGLFGLFKGRGFPGKLVKACVSKWGLKAPEVIRGNAFRLLMSGMPGCGWKRCDRLYLDLGGRPNALKRQTLAGFNALREDRTGSTWLSARQVISAMKTAVPGITDPLKPIKLGLRAKLFEIKRNGDERWIAIAPNAIAERAVASHMKRLQSAPSRWPSDIPVSQTEGDGLPSTHQAEAYRLATPSPVGCFIGGPGTGKTHTLAYALQEIMKRGESVAVAAPTGKAAVRATESLAKRGITTRATTIHQLLEIGRNGHDGGGWGFLRHAGNPIDARWLIVDEASMLDTSLMAKLLDACATGTHVLFVGDPFQLPPVGSGCPLRDFLAGGVPYGELTEVRRNAGSIVRACAAIKRGERPIIPASLDLDAEDPQNLCFIECQESQILDKLVELLGRFMRFDPVWDTQILTAVNERGDCSRVAINKRLARVLNPHGATVPQVPFAVGDKLICTSNGNMRPAEPCGKFNDPTELETTESWNANPEKTAYVANGEIGRTAAVGRDGMVWLAPSGRAIYVPASKSRQAPSDAESDSDSESKLSGGMSDFELAYAVTGHKSQGSEWPIVIIIADKSGSMVADRNWWYTANSRGAKAAIILGSRSAFETQSRRVTLDNRKTFLAEMLRNEMEA